MKTLYKLVFLLSFLFTWTMTSCSDEDDAAAGLKDPVMNSVAPVSFFRASATLNENELLVQWTNPTNKDVYKVEISYSSTSSTRAFSPSPILVDASKGTEGELLISVPCYDIYNVSAVAINRAGVRSPKETVQAETYLPQEPDESDEPETVK